jgi:hypothetical protein
MTDILSLLRKNGYESCLNDAAMIFSQASDIVFAKFGEKMKVDVIREIQSFQKIPLHEPYPYYSIAKNIFSNMFDQKESQLILNTIRKEILKRINFDSDGSIVQILDRIQKNELFEYLSEFTGHEHVLYLWNDKKSRDEIIHGFFIESVVPQGLISSVKMRIPSVDNVTYSDLFRDKETAVEQEYGMVMDVHRKNTQLARPTRLAGMDCTQWFKQGLTEEFLLLEKRIEQYFKKNKISCICGYNMNEIPDEKTLVKLLSHHDYVMFDDPHALFVNVR